MAAEKTPPKADLSQEIIEKIVPAAERPAAKPIQERHFNPREIKQNEWSAILNKDVTVNDLLNRNFWGGVAAKLRRSDKIVCMSEDGRLYVECIVFAVGGNWAEVRVFGEPIVVTRAVAAGGPATDYEVRYLGLIKEWGVVELATGREVKNDGSLKTEDAARAWLRDFLSMEHHRVA